MYYIIQDDFLDNEQVTSSSYIPLIQKYNLHHEFVKCLPFTDELSITTNRKDIFAVGSVKLSRVLYEKGLLNNFFNKNFDYEIYSKFYTDNLLNFDSKIIKFDEAKVIFNEFDNPEYLFFRPTLDNKSFNGKVYSKEEWLQFHDYITSNKFENGVLPNTKIQVSIPKVLYKELRFFIVKGKVVTGSQYRLGGNVIYDHYYEKEAVDFVEKMCRLFVLADAFVMDIVLTKDGWKIIECGCVCCAGTYLSDTSKLLNALENNF